MREKNLKQTSSSPAFSSWSLHQTSHLQHIKCHMIIVRTTSIIIAVTLFKILRIQAIDSIFLANYLAI